MTRHETKRARSLFFAVILLAQGAAFAQAYPAKPIRLVVPYPPSGVNDIVARALAVRVSEGIGQPVVVENRAGASGKVGTEFVAKAAADGHTILVGGTEVPCAWFAQGLRIVDISNPHTLREVASYIPDPAPGAKKVSSNDVFMDDRGLLYLIDRIRGLHIVERL